MSSTIQLIIETPEIFQNKTPEEVFECFQSSPWSGLLDTCNNKLSDGRFDIIVSSPVETIQAKNGRLKCTGNAQSSPLDKCPFDYLDELISEFSSSIRVSNSYSSSNGVIDTSTLPFLVGALGFFAYDLNTELDAIANPDSENNSAEHIADDFAVGIYDESIIFDNLTKRVLYCHLGKQKLLSKFTSYTQNQKREVQQKFQLKSAWHANVDKSGYLKNIAKIKDYLIAGDCYQINYAQQFKAKYEGSEWEAYKHLRAINKAPFSSFLRHNDYAILSLSPERFLQVKQGRVETKPIKGTRPRSHDPDEDKRNSDELLNAEKDKAENLMIVDLLRNDISKHCLPHTVKVPFLFKLESYPAVHHMVSTVVGKIKPESSPIKLLKGAFPGGSITGAPKVRAMQIIQELEQNKRAIYCGSIGYIGIRGDMDTSICIRTILAEKNNLICWAGGGIVLDSQASDEYQESLHKVAKILPVLSNDFSSNKS